MPRTVESILENHRAARERRNAGKPVWDHTVSFRNLIRSESLAPDEIAKLGKRVAAKIRQGLPSKWITPGDDFDYELDEILSGLEGISDTDEPEEGIVAEKEFNGWLDAFYDWADAQRVWVK